MSRNVVILGVVIVLLILGGWLLMRPKQSAVPQPTEAPTEAPVSSPSPTSSASEGAMMKESKNMVNITASSFNPKSLTIKVGDSVTWMNGDTQDHTVNSAPHPTHTVYPPLNLGLIKPGEQKSLTFPTPGTYKYHDHLNPSLTGSITVQ